MATQAAAANVAAATAPAIGETDVDRLRVVLLRLARRIRTTYADDITPSQLTVLASLHRTGPMTVGQIAEHEHVRPPSASKIVAALEQAGLVERTTDPTDRRCQPIALTGAGHAYVDRARAAGRTFLAGRLGDLDASDVAALTAALPALERLLGSVE